MSNPNSQGLKAYSTWLRLLPYLVFGGLVFSFNSATDLNYFFRGYLVLLEAQVGLVALYFLMSKLKSTKK